MSFLIAANYIVEDKKAVDDIINKMKYQKPTDSNEMLPTSSASESSVVEDAEVQRNNARWVTRVKDLDRHVISMMIDARSNLSIVRSTWFMSVRTSARIFLVKTSLVSFPNDPRLMTLYDHSKIGSRSLD